MNTVISDIRDGVLDFARKHEALQARYLAECNNNRAKRIELKLAQQVIHYAVKDLQHEIIATACATGKNKDHIAALAKITKNLRNLL